MISGVSRDFYPGHGRRKWKPEDRKTDRQKERKKERKRRREKEEKGKREREDWLSSFLYQGRHKTRNKQQPTRNDNKQK